MPVFLPVFARFARFVRFCPNLPEFVCFRSSCACAGRYPLFQIPHDCTFLYRHSWSELVKTCGLWKELRLYTSIYLCWAFISTQLSKLGLPLHVSLFLRNRGGLVATLLKWWTSYRGRWELKIVSIHPTLDCTLVLYFQPIQTGSVLLLLPLSFVLAFPLYKDTANGRAPTFQLYSFAI